MHCSILSKLALDKLSGVSNSIVNAQLNLYAVSSKALEERIRNTKS